MKFQINLGELKHRVSFYSKEVTQDEDGFKSSSLSRFLTTKCAIKENSYLDNKRSTVKKIDSYGRTFTIVLRYDPRITQKDIVEFQGEKYRIKNYINVDYNNHWLKLVIQSD